MEEFAGRSISDEEGIMKHKIGIVGCAGTGKSTLARSVSESLGIPLLESKEITASILERDGYDYSSGIQVERFLANSGRQMEILRRTIESEKSTEEFVTDRTVVDLAAYAVCEMHNHDTKALSHVFTMCSDSVAQYSHLFLCQWDGKPVGENQKRTLNPWYQFLVHALEVGIMEHWKCDYKVVSADGSTERLEGVLASIG